MKRYFTLIITVLFITGAYAQLELLTAGDNYTIDFAGFAGDGFDAAGSPGYLDADTWAVIGFSDGDKDFGEEATSGDFARGSTMGGETTGGVYGVDILGNQGILVQPTETDFTPGSLRLKIWNNTGDAIGQLDISYSLYVYNDQNRSGSFNFAHSADNISYTDEPSLDYTSGEAAAILPETATKSISLTGLNIPDGGFYYLKWEGNDVGGTGSRDEFALDDIHITPFEYVLVSEIQFASIVISAEEGETVSPALTISESADCSVEVSVDASSTATEDLDYDFTSPHIVYFSAGGSTTVTFDFDLIDDSDVEPSETVILKLNNATGGCVLGFSDTYTLNVLDNDVAAPTISDIADVTTEDINGVAESLNAYVQLTGIVHGINLSDDGGLDFTLIDGTAGIRVFNFANDLGYTVNEGDEVTVVGFIDQYAGLTEIIAESLELVSEGNTLDLPVNPITLGENTESDIITLQNVYYVDISQWLGDGTSFNLQVSDGTNTFTVRIDNSVDLSSIPAIEGADPYTLNITGIGSQFDASSPFTDGYQLMPRYAADIEINQGDAIHHISAGNISLFPNPAQSYVMITGNDILESVELINSIGETVLYSNISNSVYYMPLQDMIPGMYIVKIKTEEGIFTSIISKQ